MDFKEFQKEMRIAYLCGGTGILVSGIIWLISGLSGLYLSKEKSLLIFFIGGMLIYPLGVLLAKLFNRSGKHHKDNPLGKLAIESTAILFIGLFIAYSIYQIQELWFFPVMLMIIGVRYLVFQSIYGMKIYWLLGLLLIIPGILFLISNQPFHFGGIAGGIIEISFGVLVIVMNNRSNKTLK
ncbi:hypothetical protein [uncultured Winogradskyella sp.]|uniref:DUF7010 family protein n=1 Tax=uncultured Winogradskyella sp. TaxID=395353 RepID=UPI00260B8275|nr:hypothetical protein [uncultured Winogradskyella sp.]